MKTMEVYVGNKNTSWVTLDKDIELLGSDGQTLNNFAKLQEKLDSEKKNDKSIIGIVDGKNVRIKFHDNFKFSGIIWSSRTRLSGKYHWV